MTYEGKAYKSPFEWWNEKRKELCADSQICYEFMFPKGIKTFATILGNFGWTALGLIGLPQTYFEMKYSHEKGGYIFK